MSDKNDKTVPAEADDYKDDENQQDSGNVRRAENDPLVRETKSYPGEMPNRDEDEFTGKGRKAPDVTKQAEREADKASDKG